MIGVAKFNLVGLYPKLEIIKNLEGFNDFYVKLSNEVASLALDCFDEYFKTFRSPFIYSFYKDNPYQIKFYSELRLNSNVKYQIDDFFQSHPDAIDILNSIERFEMSLKLRERYNNRKLYYSERKETYDNLQNLARYKTTSKEGCYLATMVYGNYNHPQVIILRKFRDEILDKSRFGKWFIKSYYLYSPKLVEVLRNKKFLNKIIENVLNKFIKIINK